jgi:peroxiredoxin
LNAKYAKDVVFIGISVDTNLDRLDKFVKEKAIPWAQLADGKAFDGPIPKLYRPNGTPTLFVLDRSGGIAAKLGSAEQVEANVQRLLAQP